MLLRISSLLLVVLITPAAFAQEENADTASSNESSQETTSTDDVDAEKLFQQGRDDQFRGKYDKAIVSLKQAVAADATQTSWKLYLAKAYRYGGQPGESESILKEILDQAPDHVEAGQLLAEVYFAAEEWEAVTATLKPLLKYRHDYPTYHLLAEATYNLDEYDASRSYFREAIRLNPESAPDHYQLANIYLSENRFALAVRSYETALSLGLESSVLHYKLASAYFNLRNYFGRISEATVKAGEAGTISDKLYLIEAVPGRKDVFRVAPEKSAVFHIAKAIAGGLGDRADTQMLLANIYLNAHRHERAYEMYQKLGELVPEDDAALYAFYFAQSALGVGRYDEYLEQLRRAVQLDPDSYRSALIDGYLQVADRYNQAGQLNEYINHLALAVDESPQTTSLHLKLGNAYEEARQYDDAVQQWRMVLDLEPEHPDRTRLLNLIRRHS